MREAVVFKGDRDGLQLVIDDQADFSFVLKQLREKLAAAASFFNSGTRIDIYPGAGAMSEGQRTDLIRLLADYGLECEAKRDEPAAVAAERADYRGLGYEAQTLIVERTLRGGQQVVYPGSVVVIGDVNPNATVIAGGNIVIIGACRGVAHAGAYGDSQATITAGQLMAAQIRIAGLIARSPDQNVHKPDFLETARIKDGNVVIERSKR